MLQMTPLNKAFLTFEALSTFLTEVEDDDLRHNAKQWFKRLRSTSNILWKELQKTTQSVSEDTNFAYDEIGAYTHDVVNTALEIPVEHYNEFLDLIHKFKDETNKNIEEIN